MSKTMNLVVLSVHTYNSLPSNLRRSQDGIYQVYKEGSWVDVRFSKK